MGPSIKFAAVLVAAVLGATGVCCADEQAPVVTSQGEDVRAPSRPLKAVLSDFVANQFVGSAVWHADNVVSLGQPPTLAVRADIEIPDLEMTVRLDLRRNADKSLPASHTVELAFRLPLDFPHGEIANVPGILMKAGETARGLPLNGVSVKVADDLFLIGLSNVEADRQRNVQLMREQPWLDVPIVYSDGTRAILAVEKASLGERALAVLDPAAVEPTPTRQPAEMPRVPLDAALKYAALSSAQPNNPVRLHPTIAGPQVSARPMWSWPPLPVWWSWMPVWWSWMPWSLIESWTWQLWAQTELPGTMKLASASVPPMAPKPPSWLQTMSMVTTTNIAVPSWPRVRAPDFRLPMGPTRLAGHHREHLQPPLQFVRWSDRLEMVLPTDQASLLEVDRRCRAVGAKSPSGKIIHGCAHRAAGRCFIIRIDDPGIARHELAHCSGWKHPEP